jgi:hypothetical protein
MLGVIFKGAVEPTPSPTEREGPPGRIDSYELGTTLRFGDYE